MVAYGPVGRPRGRERITINEATGQAGGDKESRSCSYRPASIKSGFRLGVFADSALTVWKGEKRRKSCGCQ